MSFVNERLTATATATIGVGPRGSLSGQQVAEDSQTESDATSNVLTFAANIYAVEIYHSEATPQEFEINGLTISIAAGGWRSEIGGEPAATVTLPSGVTGIVVTRLE